MSHKGKVTAIKVEPVNGGTRLTTLGKSPRGTQYAIEAAVVHTEGLGRKERFSHIDEAIAMLLARSG